MNFLSLLQTFLTPLSLTLLLWITVAVGLIAMGAQSAKTSQNLHLQRNSIPDNETLIHNKNDIVKEIDRLYHVIGIGKNLSDDAQIEVGRWVNIISYISDNIIDQRLDNDKAHDYLERATIGINAVVNDKPLLWLSREIMHEIATDIYRTEDWFSKGITRVTNGSPSFTIVIGVIFSILLFIPLLTFISNQVPGSSLAFHLRLRDVELHEGELAIIASSAFLGGIASILTRLDQFEARRAIDPKLLFLTALFKPFLGALFGLVALSLQGIGLIAIAGEAKISDNITFFLFIVGFLSGFSERLAKDFIGSAERKLNVSHLP